MVDCFLMWWDPLRHMNFKYLEIFIVKYFSIILPNKRIIVQIKLKVVSNKISVFCKD